MGRFRAWIAVVAIFASACGEDGPSGSVATCGGACPAGFTCFESVCRQACNSDQDCLDRSQACDRGVCLPVAGASCQTDSDCSMPPPCRLAAGASCLAGACRYRDDPTCAYATCSPTGSCAVGATCLLATDCATASCECADATCATRVCASGPCGECMFTGDGTVCDGNLAETVSCDDADACTEADHCVAGVCLGGGPVDCDDADACTTDGCSSVDGCTHQNTCGCSGAADCDDDNPCTDDTCPAGECVYINNLDPCDDGNACTLGELCSDAACGGGTPVSCTDLNSCTDNGCDPATGCTVSFNTGPCDDEDAATGADRCDGLGTCVGQLLPVGVVPASVSADGDVVDFAWLPDERGFVLLGDLDSNERYELFAVDADGSNWRRLNQTLPSGGDVVRFVLSPTGDVVVFVADAETNDVFELYAIRLDGSLSVKLSPASAAGVLLDQIVIAPNGLQVAFSRREAGNRRELWLANIDGTDLKAVGGIVNDGRDVDDVRYTPDGSQVLFTGDPRVNDIFEAWSIDASTGVRSALHDPLTGTQDIDEIIDVSADSSIALARANLLSADEMQLFALDLTGGGATPRPLGDPVIADGAIGMEARFSPSGRFVLYRMRSDPGAPMELFRAPINGDPPLRVGTSIDAQGNIENFAVASDESSIVFVGEVAGVNQPELWAVDFDGTSPRRLTRELTGGRAVTRFSYAPNPEHVVYLANEEALEATQLYVARVDGTETVRLNGPLVAGGSVRWFEFLGRDGRIAYLADERVNGVVELFTVGLDGAGLARPHRPLVQGGDVLALRASKTGGLAALADADVDGQVRLFSQLDPTADFPGLSPEDPVQSLADAGLVARWWMNEAAVGPGPPLLIDAAPTPVNLPLFYDGNLAYRRGPLGRGLRWFMGDEGGKATLPIATTELESRFAGGKAATLEMVIDLHRASDSPPRLIYFGEGTSRGVLSVLYDGLRGVVEVNFDVGSGLRDYVTAIELANTGPHVLAVRIDSAQASMEERVQVFLDGRPFPTHWVEGQPLPQDATVAFPADARFFIGNRMLDERSPEALISYVALYSIRLSAANMRKHAEILLNSDDP